MAYEKSGVADSVDSITIGGYLGPKTRYSHRGPHGDLFLHDCADLTDAWWGMKYSGYPEQPVIVGRSAPMLQAFERIATVAPTRASVLIQGASGTGKELVARALASALKGPFHAVNCQLPTEGVSFEDTLFGRVDKIIHGAPAAPGAFQLADGGTLFLDNIECLSARQQAKLLRVLETKEVYRLGSARVDKVNIRLVCASNCDLAKLVDQRQFREDLYYRINVVPIYLPPLRARKKDIPLLAAYFFMRNRIGTSRRVDIISSETLEQLRSHNWQGNVREFAHAIERILILGHGPTIGPHEFEPLSQSTPDDIRPTNVVATTKDRSTCHGRWMKEIETLLQKRPRAQTAELARLLGCSQRTVQRAVKALAARGMVIADRDANDPRIIWYRTNGRHT